MVHIINGGGIGSRIPAPPEKPPKIKPGKGGSGGGGSAVRVKAGSLIAPASTGVVSYNVGFRPDVIIFLGGGATTDYTLTNSYRAFIGFATGSSNQYSLAIANNDASASMVSSSRLASKAITLVTPQETLNGEASFVQFTSNGFELNWTDAPDAQYIIPFLAIKGITAKAITFSVPTGTGNTSVATVGFQPDAMLVVAPTSIVSQNMDASQLHAAMSIGLVTPSAQYCLASFHNDGSLVGDARRMLKTDRIAVMPTISDNSNDYALSLVSMDANGFTYNKVLAVTAACPFLALCMKSANGVQFAVGTCVKPTGAAPQTLTVSGLAFRPKGLILINPRMPAVSANDSTTSVDGVLSFGVASGASEQGGWLVFEDDGPSDTNNFNWTSNTYLIPDGAWSAKLSRFNNDGFELTINPNDAAADLMGYLAFG